MTKKKNKINETKSNQNINFGPFFKPPIMSPTMSQECDAKSVLHSFKVTIKWAEKNKLVLNANNNKSPTICTIRRRIKLYLTGGNVQIEEVTEVKLLGIKIQMTPMDGWTNFIL